MSSRRSMPWGRKTDAIGDFSAFYKAHASGVLLFLAKRCLDAEVALDLTAESFAQALKTRRRFRGSTDEEAAAWIYAIARNQLNNYFRRGQVEKKALAKLGLAVPNLANAESERIEELAGLSQLRIEVRRHFERLSAEQQDAVRLRVVDEQPYPEVARQLNISEEAARARVSRGLRQLGHSVDSSLTKGALHHG